jgi:hypothetical protein
LVSRPEAAIVRKRVRFFMGILPRLCGRPEGSRRLSRNQAAAALAVWIIAREPDGGRAAEWAGAHPTRPVEALYARASGEAVAYWLLLL